MQKIDIEQYDYALSDDRIAKYPLENRDKSKLLVYKNAIEESVFENIHHFLPENAALVFNNTKVIHARLFFRKPTGAPIEIFCLEPIEPVDYEQAFQQTESVTWECMVGNLKKWKHDILLNVVKVGKKRVELFAEKMSITNGKARVKFSWDSDLYVSFSEILEATGTLPIPPYLNRETEALDLVRYQTVYSKIKGSVAAPTAGLHFTENVLKNLNQKNISTHELTLHVGAGTFAPVKHQNAAEHHMHTEHFIVDKILIETLLQQKSARIAVGTTSARTLESLYWCGLKIIEKQDNPFQISQWYAYQKHRDVSFSESFEAILNYLITSNLEYIYGHTQIMIVPGYQFKTIDALITNFHQPKSTLLLLVSALVGSPWKAIYDYATQHHFRFLSYGDSSLLWAKN